MAIELMLNLGKEVLDEEMVLKGIHDLGFTSTVETPTQDSVFHCTSCYDTLGFMVTLVKSFSSNSPPPEIRLLGGAEFECRQFLTFRFDKWIELTPAFERALKMIFNLMNHVRTRAFLETGDSTEICFFNNDKSILFNISSGMFTNIDIKKELPGWKVIEVTL